MGWYKSGSEMYTALPSWWEKEEVVSESSIFSDFKWVSNVLLTCFKSASHLYSTGGAAHYFGCNFWVFFNASVWKIV